jgi:SAM-dependent methyltransferase
VSGIVSADSPSLDLANSGHQSITIEFGAHASARGNCGILGSDAKAKRFDASLQRGTNDRARRVVSNEVIVPKEVIIDRGFLPMTPGDLSFLGHVIELGLVKGETLEVGSRTWQGVNGNAAKVCAAAGLHWQGADLESGPGVDFVLDIFDEAAVAERSAQWDSVLAFNLLEHVYDPIIALRNCLRLTAVGGRCFIVTPTVWQIHDFPADYWRPMPDFYFEFARRERQTVELMYWIYGNALIPVSELHAGSQKLLPSKDSLRQGIREGYSRVVHRLFNTTGRHTFFPYSALGVVMTRDRV